MDHLHSHWKSKIANMGEAPEVTPEVIERVSDLYRRQWQSIAPPYAPFEVPQVPDNVIPISGLRGDNLARLKQCGDIIDTYMRPQQTVTQIWQEELPAPVTRESIDLFLGRSWASKVRRRQRTGGTYAAAKQLRKQGVGLLVARLLLLGRP